MAKTYLENWIWSALGGTGASYEEAFEKLESIGRETLTKMGCKDPDAIQPADESFDCCLCGRHFDNEYSHNAQPVKDGRCCIECNATKVMPARLKDMGVIK